MKQLSVHIILICAILIAPICLAGPVAFQTANANVQPNEVITINLVLADGYTSTGILMDSIRQSVSAADGYAGNPQLNGKFTLFPSPGTLVNTGNVLIESVEGVVAGPGVENLASGVLYSFNYHVPNLVESTDITIFADTSGSNQADIVISGITSGVIPDSLVLHVTPPVINYSLTTQVIGGHGSILPAPGSYENGAQVNLTATPDSGYRVKAWTGANNTPAAGSNTNTVTMSGNKTVSVEFEVIPNYTLTTQVIGGHGAVSPTTGSYPTDTVVDLAATPESGYRVKAWSGANITLAAHSNTNTVTMSGNKTVTIEFEVVPPSYSLTAQVVGGHGSVSPTSGSYESGAQVNLTATPDSDYRVKAWTGANYSPAAGNNSNIVTMSGNKTVTVEFETNPIISYILTTQVNGGHGTLSPPSGIHGAGTQVALTAAPQAGYRVKTWTGAANTPAAGSNSNTVIMSGNKTVTVEFEVIPPTYSLSAQVVGGHGTVLPASGNYEAGTQVPLTATPQAGYRVKAWTGAANTPAAGSNSNTVTMSGNKTVTVEFEAIPQTYSLTTQVVGGHGTISPPSGNYDVGTQVALTAAPQASYRVKAWTGADNTPAAGSNSNTVTISGNKTVTIEFEIIPTTSYMLTTQVSGGHGTLSPPSGSFAAGTQVTLTAAPADGYQIKAWTGTDDNWSTGSTNTVTMTQDQTVTVQFAAMPTIEKCVVKAGNKENTDSLQLSGSFAADDSDIENADSIKIHIFSDSGFNYTEPPIPFAYADVSNGKYRYTRKVYSGEIGGVTSFVFDLNHQTFSLKAEKFDLTGLSSPFTLELEIGNYTGVCRLDENMINGLKKQIPIALMKTFANELRVGKVTYKQGAKPNSDSLSVSGEIAVQNIGADLSQQNIEIHWGDYSILLPAGKMVRKTNRNAFVYEREKGDPVSKAVFDLDNCTFGITIKNTTIPPRQIPATFRIVYNSFDESVQVE